MNILTNKLKYRIRNYKANLTFADIGNIMFPKNKLAEANHWNYCIQSCRLAPEKYNPSEVVLMYANILASLTNTQLLSYTKQFS